MEYKDYYATLGVPRTASQAEIKKAFRSLARKHHPDVSKGDAASEARFKDVNEAYEVLGDAKKRTRYDQLGANWEQFSRAGTGGGRGGAGGGDPFAGFGFGGPGSGGFGQGAGSVHYEFRTSGGDASGFSDFFRMFFGGEAPGGADPFGGATGTPRPGTRTAPPPVEARADVSLEEAFHGTARLVEVDGKRLEVQVPRGVDDGSRIRLRGKGGGTGPGARDLVLVTRLLPHAVFTRKGADLVRDLTIELRDALLGGEVRVPTLSGAVLLRIPAGTQPGRTFRLAGQGMPKLNADGRGDLLVRIAVRIPTLTDERDRAAAEAFLDTLERPAEHHGAPA